MQQLYRSFLFVGTIIKVGMDGCLNFFIDAQPQKGQIASKRLSWFNWCVSFAPEFQCCYFCESSCLFYLCFNFHFYVSEIMHL